MSPTETEQLAGIRPANEHASAHKGPQGWDEQNCEESIWRREEVIVDKAHLWGGNGVARIKRRM